MATVGGAGFWVVLLQLLESLDIALCWGLVSGIYFYVFLEGSIKTGDYSFLAEHKNTKHFIILTSCSNISLAKENYENKSKVNKTKAMSAKNTQLGKDNLFKKWCCANCISTGNAINLNSCFIWKIKLKSMDCSSTVCDTVKLEEIVHI